MRYTILDAGSPSSDDRQVKDGSGLVRDNETGLVWTRFVFQPNVNSCRACGVQPSAAPGHSPNFTFEILRRCAEKRGMRLPSLSEALGIAGEHFSLDAWPQKWAAWTTTIVPPNRVPLGEEWKARFGVSWYVFYKPTKYPYFWQDSEFGYGFESLFVRDY